MLNGETLTVAIASENYGFERAAALKHLNALAETVPGVVHKKCDPEQWQFLPTHAQQATSIIWALTAARELLAGFRNSGIGVHLDELAQQMRLRSGAAAPLPGDLSRMVYSLSGMHTVRAADAKVLDRVMVAVSSSKQVAFEYAHFEGDRDQVVLEPYSLIVHDHSLYVYGRCLESTRDHVDTQRLYNLHRISAFEHRTEGFAYPVRAAYDPERLLSIASGRSCRMTNSSRRTSSSRSSRRWRASWRDTRCTARKLARIRGRTVACGSPCASTSRSTWCAGSEGTGNDVDGVLIDVIERIPIDPTWLAAERARGTTGV